jgi:3-oxoacyl-[acyl-carrier protein] reductase
VTTRPLDGRVAIVTGGTRGIGAAIAGLLAEHGAAVVVSGRDAARMQESVRALEERGASVHGVVADAASREDADRLVETAKERYGRLDLLVNNAGITRDGLLIRMKDDDWDRVLDVNLRGAFLMSRASAKVMVRQRSGRIINIASTAGAMGNPGQANYSAAKAGLVADTRLWADELAPYGIRTGAIAPGLIETPILQAMPPEELAKLGEQVPLGRLGKPSEIFQAVKFIIECDYFTGRCVDVDGGLKM